MYDGELEYVERLLDEDVRNNSAWNQRFFLLNHEVNGGRLDGRTLEREVDFTLAALRKVADNESAWNYLRG